MQNIILNGEPIEVTNIREKILSEFNELIFVEEGHKYYLHGKELPSVTTITHKFCECPFDKDEKAEAYAAKNGETPEYWKDKWLYTSLKATTTGTLVHEYAEGLGWLRNGHPELMPESCKPKYVKDKEWLIPTRPKEEAVLKFYDEFPDNLYFVLAETKVYSNKSEASNVSIPYCGTFDLLTWYQDPKNPPKSGLVIEDWKTNGDIYKSYSRSHGRMLLPPFEHYYEEPLSYYFLQINLYALCLYGIGLPVIGGRIIWLKDDGTYELVKVPMFFKEPWFRECW